MGTWKRGMCCMRLYALPMKERRDRHMMKLSFKYANDQQKPKYIDISLRENTRNLISSSAPLIASTCTSNALRNDAAELFNKLSAEIRNAKTATEFSTQTQKNLYIAAKGRLLI